MTGTMASGASVQLVTANHTFLLTALQSAAIWAIVTLDSQVVTSARCARICQSDQRERGSARALSLVGCGPPALGQTTCEATWQCCFALAPLAVTLSVSVVTPGRLAQPVPPSSVRLVAANHVSRTFVAAGHALGVTLARAPVRRTSLSVAVSSSSWHVRTRSVRGPCGSDCRWATHRFRKTCRRTWMSVVQGTRPRWIRAICGSWPSQKDCGGQP